MCPNVSDERKKKTTNSKKKCVYVASNRGHYINSKIVSDSTLFSSKHWHNHKNENDKT